MNPEAGGIATLRSWTRLDTELDRLETTVRRRIAAADHARNNSRLVSVIMTTFRSADFLADSMASILTQSHQNLELIVVDDASDDGTLEMLKAIQRDDDRVRVLSSRRNRGTYWAKNLGILHALGDYVALQDSDDFSDPTRIERQVRALEMHRTAKVCTCNYTRIDAHGQVLPNRGLRGEARVHNHGVRQGCRDRQSRPIRFGADGRR